MQVSTPPSRPSILLLLAVTSRYGKVQQHVPSFFTDRIVFLQVVEWLVNEAGAIPELEDGEGEVRLELHIRVKVSADARMVQTALHKAAYRGHLDVVRFLVEKGVAVDATDADGWTVSTHCSA